VEVHPVDTATGVRGGQVLGHAGAAPELAVDALLEADADVRRLASSAARVFVTDVDA